MKQAGSLSVTGVRESAASSLQIWRAVLLFLGVLTASTAVIFIKASSESPYLVASYRLFVAAVVLLPLFIRERRQSADRYSWQMLRWSAVPAVALAIHFMSWVIGARMTHTANASLVVNMLPVALPFFLWLFYRERLTKNELFGSIIAVSGIFLLSGASFRISKQTFVGDMICLGSMLAFAVYMALGRKNGARIGLWTYLVPLYFMAGTLCLIVALFFVNPIKAYQPMDILYILALGILPTVFGHSVFNYSMKHFRGQVVGLANLGQVVFAGMMGYLFFREIPSASYYLAALLILAGILTVIVANNRRS